MFNSYYQRNLTHANDRNQAWRFFKKIVQQKPLQIYCIYNATLSSLFYFSANCKYFTCFHEWLGIFWLFFDILFHTMIITSSLAAMILITNSIFNTRPILTPHCVKSIRIWSNCGPYFPAFGPNTEILAHGKKQKRLLLETKRYIHPSRQLHVQS